MGRHLALAARDRYTGPGRQQRRLPPVVPPAQGLLQPTGVQILQRPERLGRRLQVPGPINIDHQVTVRADHVANDLHPGHVLGQAQCADLGLEAAVPSGDQPFNLVAQFGVILAFAIVSTGDIAGHRVAPAAEQLRQRHAGDLADDVPAGQVDRRGDADERLTPPALFASQPGGGQAEDLAVEPLGRRGVFAEDLFGEVCFEDPRDGRDVGIGGGKSKAFDPVRCRQLYQQLIRRG